jgi:hypothetical protein
MLHYMSNESITGRFHCYHLLQPQETLHLVTFGPLDTLASQFLFGENLATSALVAVLRLQPSLKGLKLYSIPVQFLHATHTKSKRTCISLLNINDSPRIIFKPMILWACAHTVR